VMSGSAPPMVMSESLPKKVASGSRGPAAGRGNPGTPVTWSSAEFPPAELLRRTFANGNFGAPGPNYRTKDNSERGGLPLFSFFFVLCADSPRSLVSDVKHAPKVATASATVSAGWRSLRAALVFLLFG
jgi:hypothetical protein